MTQNQKSIKVDTGEMFSHVFAVLDSKVFRNEPSKCWRLDHAARGSQAMMNHFADYGDVGLYYCMSKYLLLHT